MSIDYTCKQMDFFVEFECVLRVMNFCDAEIMFGIETCVLKRRVGNLVSENDAITWLENMELCNICMCLFYIDCVVLFLSWCPFVSINRCFVNFTL